MFDLTVALRYRWVPFLLDGEHLCFTEDLDTQIRKERCSHWGAVIYKWEGVLDEGEKRGKTGVLVGETYGLRARIRQYASGTQAIR